MSGEWLLADGEPGYRDKLTYLINSTFEKDSAGRLHIDVQAPFFEEQRLRRQVAAGELTAEEAREKFAEAEEQMWRRYRAAEERMAGGDERRESSELMELKARIEERLEALGIELQEAVAAGTMTTEDAKAKFTEAEERMWDRYRAAEERMAAAGERRESPELAELKAGIEEQIGRAHV